jgi:hypothetical protein
MCLKTKKMLFACGCAFFGLVFLCATNLEKGTLNVINGNGKGSKLAALDQLKLGDKRLEVSDVFLDNVSGDIYNYNYDTAEWVAKSNVGIHNQRAAEEFTSLGKYIISTPVFRVRAVDNKQICVARKSESICYLRKMYLQHWALMESHHEFLVPSVANWQVHPFNFKVPEKTFNVLADSKIGPQIILFKNDNVISTQFEISNTYPDTLSPLRQFIKTKLLEIKSLQKNQITSIFSVDGTWWDSTSSNKYRINKSIKKVSKAHMAATSKGFRCADGMRFKQDPNTEKRTQPNEDVFKHSGYASKARGYNYVTNNAIQNSRKANPANLAAKDPFWKKFGDYFGGEDSIINKEGGHHNQGSFKTRGSSLGLKMHSGPTVKQAFGRAAYPRESTEIDGGNRYLENNLMDMDEGTMQCSKETKHKIRQTLLPEWEPVAEHG